MDFVKGISRYRIVPKCPCGKSNRDGKFSPLKGYTDKGKCHSCGKMFLPEDTTRKSIDLPYNLVGVLCPLKSSLYKIYHKDKVDKVFNSYYVGNWHGYTMFPQIDKLNHCRTAKLIKYNGLKRDKSTSPQWLHKTLNYKDFKLEQCLFGLHKVEGVINIVESEKTALIATLEYGGCWVATGGKDNISLINSISTSSILLYPDNDEGMETWSKYGEIDYEYKKMIKGKPKGFDLADLIIEKHEEYQRKQMELLEKDFEEIRELIKKDNLLNL